MKKLKKIWRKLTNRCQRCGLKLHTDYSESFALGMHDMPSSEPSSEPYCLACSQKDPIFLELYDMLEKGL
jgi:hypothetical protein